MKQFRLAPASALVLACIAICSSHAPLASAQTGKGIISGRVVDSAGAILQGARVESQPALGIATTNDQGEFILTNVSAGEYTVTISYLGFAAYSAKVTVAANATARVSAVLKVASQSEEVFVTAERLQGEAEAINRTRASDNILQVLPVEVITSLPNTNVADALGRLPSVTLERDEGEGKYVQIRGLEPRLSNVTIDGVNVAAPEAGVRQIKLDTIPANLVESVEINKTLSANQDGDAIGGSVNLKTKTAEERPTLYLNGLGGYTPIVGGRPLYEIDGTVGKRFGESKKLGVLLGGSYDWNGRGIDDVEPSVGSVSCSPGPQGCNEALNPSTARDFPTYSSTDLREYRYYRARLGFAGSVDYKLGELSGLYVHFLYSHFNNFGDRWVYTPGINTFETPTQGSFDGSMAFNTQIRRPVDVIGSLAAGGKHVFSKWWLAYDLSVSRSSEEDVGYASASFNGPGGTPTNPLVFTVDTTNPHTPKLVPQGGFNVYDPNTYFLNNGDISRNYSPQVNLQGGFAAARNYSTHGHFGSFEFGAKLRNVHKFEDANDQYYMLGPNANPSDPALAMANFPNSFSNSNYYNKAYPLGPLVDYGKIRTFLNGSGASFFVPDPVNTAQNTYPNNYDLVERVSAGYVMNTLDIGRFRLQTGLRFEGTQESLEGFTVNFDANGNVIYPITPNNHSSSYLDVLPSVQVRYDLHHDAAIRASFGRGIARPNYGDLPPSFSANGSANQVNIGNPTLNPTRANNYDLLFEKYLQPLGLIQAGFFFKQLSNPIYSVKSLITTNQFGPQYIGYELIQPVNGSNAQLYGFEISYQQRLSFLPSVLNSFGISANYSYTHSYVDSVPGRTDSPPLQRQAPNSWNVSPTYDRGRLSARLGISHNDANIFQYNYFNLNPDGTPNPVPLGKSGPNGDVYLYGHTQVDAQASFRMYRGLQLIVSGLNLTNEVFGFYQGSPQYPIQREFYKPTYSFGLRYTLSNEPK